MSRGIFKIIMFRLLRTFIFILLPLFSSGQSAWKLEKNKNGIKVYSSQLPNSDYKAIRAECLMAGNYSGLISTITDVPLFTTWIYHAKICSLMVQNSDLDFIYYSETSLPWPLSDRVAAVHVVINTDSLPKFMTITGSGECWRIPESDDFVPVTHYSAHWNVTMPTANTIFIKYELELNPGGEIPVWIINMFAANGPYETFSNLAEKLKN